MKNVWRRCKKVTRAVTWLEGRCLVIGQMGNRSAREIAHSVLLCSISNHTNILSFQEFRNPWEYESYYTALHLGGEDDSESTWVGFTDTFERQSRSFDFFFFFLLWKFPVASSTFLCAGHFYFFPIFIRSVIPGVCISFSPLYVNFLLTNYVWEFDVSGFNGFNGSGNCSFKCHDQKWVRAACYLYCLLVE